MTRVLAPPGVLDLGRSGKGWLRLELSIRGNIVLRSQVVIGWLGRLGDPGGPWGAESLGELAPGGLAPGHDRSAAPDLLPEGVSPLQLGVGQARLVPVDGEVLDIDPHEQLRPVGFGDEAGLEPDRKEDQGVVRWRPAKRWCLVV